MDTIQMKKGDLLIALAAKRREAARLDREATAKYRKDLAAAVKVRRAYFAGLAKLSDADLAKLDGYEMRRGVPGVPPCPVSWTGRLEGAYRLIQMDMRSFLTVDAALQKLLTLGENVPRTICELNGRP